jgi:uroporphyrinogen-III decarboxylase
MYSHPAGFPLQDWAAWKNYVPPDPSRDGIFGPRDWDQVERALHDAKRRGDLAVGGGLPHGFMYQRLTFLRGFENLMLDMGLDDPRLYQLIAMVEGYNTAVIDKHLDLGAERLSFGDDLGLSQSLPMSPTLWRKFIKPSYERMFGRCRERGTPIYLHTDGHIVEIIPDLIDVGVTILNPQFRSNGLEALKEVARGRVVLHQEVDAQLLPFATPSEIEAHVNEIFEALYLPEGGLMMLVEFAPDVPLENIEAALVALERVCRPPEPEST